MEPVALVTGLHTSYTRLVAVSYLRQCPKISALGSFWYGTRKNANVVEKSSCRHCYLLKR
jgi:hypothetical protein